MRKIGILGGTFDPVHYGHLAMAKTAYEKAGLDEVIIVPGGNMPHKNKVTADKYARLLMARLATSDIPWISVSDYEVQKQTHCYSVQTLAHFKEKYKEDKLYFILGADSYKSLDTWYQYEKLKKLCTFLVCEREGTHLPDAECIGMIPVSVSSTQIRQAIKNGEPIEEYVPKAVYEYIKQNHLYEGVAYDK